MYVEAPSVTNMRSLILDTESTLKQTESNKRQYESYGKQHTKLAF
jgi:hypothetical protein